MTSNALYHDIILEHFEYPRNKCTCEGADASARGANAMCGDDLLVSLRLDGAGGGLDQVCWDGHACAIGEASASMMTEAVTGGSTDDARRWVASMRGLLTGRTQDVAPDLDLGDLESLEGIKQYPVRIKCALLAWEAFEKALSLAERKRVGMTAAE